MQCSNILTSLMIMPVINKFDSCLQSSFQELRIQIIELDTNYSILNCLKHFIQHLISQFFLYITYNIMPIYK